MSEDRKHTEQPIDSNAETKFIDLEGRCAPGIIDPLLARPLWDSHRYAKMNDWCKIYCPTHQIIYDRIQQQNKLNGLDGQ